MEKVRIESVTSKRLVCGVRDEPYYLSGIDLLPTHTGIPIVWVYPNGLDVERFEAGLVETLKKYPTLSGRLKSDAQGHVYMDRCDGGVDVRVRRCAGRLEDFGPNNHMQGQVASFSTPIYPWRVVDRDTPMLTIDISRFDDGGAVLSITGVHSVMDGTAFFRFVQEWAKACHGVAPVGPTNDKEVLITLGKANAETPYVGGLLYRPKVLERIGIYARFGWQHLTSMRKDVFRISADRIEEWKAASRDELAPGEFVGTVDLVTAHCLKVLSPTISSRSDRRVGIVNDLRYKRGIAIPRGFFGNALTQSEVVFSADELSKKAPVLLARKLREVGARDVAEELSGYVAYVERNRQEKSISKLLMRTVAATLDAGMMVNNYRVFPIYEMDFGSGRPSWHDNPRLVYRALKVVSTPSMDGGVDIHLTANKRELAAARAAYGAS